MRAWIIGLIGLLVAGPVAAQPAPGARVEVPITLVRLTDGTLRFTVPVGVGGTTVEAQLDTGSSGLRLLPSAVPDGAIHAGGRPSKETYGSGVRLLGEIAQTPVTIGGLTATVPIELTTRVECVEEKPRCPASRMAPGQYRIGADGLAGQGFLAIIGIGMRPADAVNPVAHLGSGRWIVILPKPGDNAPGKLIINPDPSETEGYALYTVPEGKKRDAMGGPAWRDNQLGACLNDLDAKSTTCGPTLLDTGAVGFRFAFDKDPLPNWPRGTRAALAFPLADGKQMATPFTVMTAPGTAVRYQRPTTANFVEGLNAGFYPFFAFDVFYDMQAGKIGLKPR